MEGEQTSILVVGSGLRTSLENMYLRAFRKNGYTNVHLFDIEQFVPYFFRRRFINHLTLPGQHITISRNLIAHLRVHQRQYDIIIIFKGMQFSRLTLEKCRELSVGTLWVNINPDDPFNISSQGASNPKVVESIPFYDLYCIWSRRLIERLRCQGAKRVVYLPFGFDEDFHQPAASLAQKMDVISFVGSWDPERERILSELTGYNLVVYGNGWNRLNLTSPLKQSVRKWDLFGEELARVIGESAVSLNLLRPQNEGSHNMRTFEIPAMGGLMLTSRSAEQQAFFPENEACYMYADIAELKEKIDYILANRPEANRVRERGMALVREHSYINRVQNLMQELEI